LAGRVAVLDAASGDAAARFAFAAAKAADSIITAAPAVLEAAIRSENDLIELLSPDTAYNPGFRAVARAKQFKRAASDSRPAALAYASPSRE
jgi:hypothetical protein